MLLGLDSYSYHLAFGAHPDFRPDNPISFFDFMEKVKKLGLDGFQIDPMHLANRDRSYLAEIRDHASTLGLFLEYGTCGVEPENLERELEICVFLGSPVLRTFIGFDRYCKGANISAECDKTIAQLNAVKQSAEKFNVKLAVENHGDASTDELIHIIKSVNSPFVGICLDLGNPYLTLESDPLAAALKMAPYAFTTHFKDYAVQLTNYGCKITGAALGEGNIDLHGALQILGQHTALDRIILEIPVEAKTDPVETIQNEENIVSKSVIFARDELNIN